MAASDARVGGDTVSLRHSHVRLEPLQRLYLPLLDGTRTRDDLIAHALDLAERGELQVSGPDGPYRGATPSPPVSRPRPIAASRAS